MRPEFALALAQGAIYHALGSALVGFDASSTMTGWCVHWPPDLHHMPARPTIYEHGQEPTVALAWARVLDVIGATPLSLLAIEEPVDVSKGAQWKLAWACGEAHGRAADRLIDERCLWTPKQQTWRAVRKVARGCKGREAINTAIHQWAEAHVGHPLRAGESPELDRANAIGIVDAALELMKEAANEQHEQL